MNQKGVGLATVLVPLAFLVGFTALGSTFDYPQILREPTAEVLEKFRSSEAQIMPAWFLMFFAACVFIPLSGALSFMFHQGIRKSISITLGLAAGLVQLIGLSRWIFAVPVLARLEQSPDTAVTARAIFEVLHQFLGVGLGEFAGYLFTALWTIVLCLSLDSHGRKKLALLGHILSIGILSGCLEMFGFSIFGAINAIAYLAWSLWMNWLGILILRGEIRHDPQQ